jgi:hypothetical protein
VAEDDLRLGRFAQDAHVGHAAMGHEVTRAGGVPAELGALCVPVLRLLDLAGDGRDHHVATKRHPGVRERAERLHVARERALHVRDSEPVEPSVLDESARLEAGHVPEPRLAARVRGVHVTVEHEARPAADTCARAEHVRPPVLDLLPLDLQPHVEERLAHELRHRLFRAREARRPDRA